jgi:hypothetical protein
MVRVRWLAAADEACLLGGVAQMLAVAVPARCGDPEDALIDLLGGSPEALDACRSSCSVTASAAAASVEVSVATGGERPDSFCSNACSRSLASAIRPRHARAPWSNN